MTTYLDLFHYRELFGSLFRRDLRAKYKGSVLGLAWSLAHPIVLMLVYLLVFSVMLQIQTVARRPLLAVPARRPARVGLLRHLAPVGVPQPAREREPDPQGPLPAPARAALDGRDAARRLRGDARDRRRPQPRLHPGGPRHRLAVDPARRARRLPRRGVLARGRVAERALPRRRAPGRGAPAALVLPDARPLLARRDPGRRGLSAADQPRSLRKSADAGDRGGARPALLRASCRRPATRSTSPSRRWSRSRSGRSSSAASTTAWQSKSDPAVEDRRFLPPARRQGGPGARPGSSPARSDGSSNG